MQRKARELMVQIDDLFPVLVPFRCRRVEAQPLFLQILQIGKDHDIVFIGVQQPEAANPIRPVSQIFQKNQPIFFLHCLIAGIYIFCLQHKGRTSLCNRRIPSNDLNNATGCQIFHAAIIRSIIPRIVGAQFQSFTVEFCTCLEIIYIKYRTKLIFEISHSQSPLFVCLTGFHALRFFVCVVLLFFSARFVDIGCTNGTPSAAGALDGRGDFNGQISTGLRFLDHMLAQIAHHGGVALAVDARGDLDIDEHHTMEDVAITLGEAVDRALGAKAGIARYGFALPMDDCRALALLDFGGRIDFEWDASFRRERVGDVPTEMFRHFFHSFACAARCNLQISAHGDNDHHKAEAVFKAFARALRMAVAHIPFDYTVPSSKGVL